MFDRLEVSNPESDDACRLVQPSNIELMSETPSRLMCVIPDASIEGRRVQPLNMAFMFLRYVVSASLAKMSDAKTLQPSSIELTSMARARLLRERSSPLSDVQPLNMAFMFDALLVSRPAMSTAEREVHPSNIELMSVTLEVATPAKLRVLSEVQPLSMPLVPLAAGTLRFEMLSDMSEVQPSQRLSRLVASGMLKPERLREAIEEQSLNMRAMFPTLAMLKLASSTEVSAAHPSNIELSNN